MDITTLAAWGEFLGGIGVIVSLIYLASQIRQNTKTIRASNFSEHLTAIGQFAAMLVDPETASLYLRGLDDFGGLSSEDQVRFNGLMSQEWNRAWRTLHLHQQGLIDDQLVATQMHALTAFLGNPGVRQWWEASQHWWDADFRDFVYGLIREGEAAG